MIANELRIGNIVNDEDGVPMYIGGLWPVMGSYNFKDSAGNSGPVSILTPIPLTEEILLKCGFVFKGGDGFMSPHNTEHWYFSLGIGFIPHSYKNSIKSDGYVGVKYLHELQNLYYHLFRTELDIKL